MHSQQPESADNEIDFRDLIIVIWQGKWLIIAITIIFAVASIFYALSLPNIYKSEALLASVSDDVGMKVPGQLGGLAALAGVNLGGGSSDKTGLALEIIKSRDFISRFINKYDLFVPLIAAKGWSRNDNVLEIDAKLYDSATQQWLRKVNAPFVAKPSLLESHEAFIKLLNVSQDTSSGMVRISIEHYSPFLAKKWLDLLIAEINEEMRQREITEAQNSIAYLNVQLATTNIADVRGMLFSLIEEQTKKLMLANVREEYVLKTVDPAIVPEKKAKPARALMVVMATFLAGMLAVFIVLIRHFYISAKS